MQVESLKLTSDDLRRLVLEVADWLVVSEQSQQSVLQAVAYGSLLNDSEKQAGLSC